MKIMSVDYGDVRTGIASCDKTEFLASPVCMIEERNPQKCAERVAFKAEELRAEEIVIGLPKNMDGSEGFRADACKEFAEMVKDLTAIPVKMWDERRTTITAHNILNETNTRGKKRKAVVDQVAAVIILEGYMEYRKNMKAREQDNEN